MALFNVPKFKYFQLQYSLKSPANMLQHGFVLMYRNALRFKGTFFINLIGLSSALTCVLLIYLWTWDELSFDKYHENDKRLFQVMYHENTGGEIKTTGQTPYFLADALKNEIPEIQYASTTTPPLFFPDFTISSNEKYIKAIGKFVESDFFRMFSYTLIEGNAGEVLQDKNSVVISERLAMTLFNTTENLIGKSLEYEMLHLKNHVLISGVFKEIPSHSSENFDFILSFETIRDFMGLQKSNYSWDYTDPFFTYVVLKENADVETLNTKLQHFIKTKQASSPFRMFLIPFSDAYLYGNFENGKPAGGRIDYVILFSIIGVFILVIACINFINLSTARARMRLKEIGIKKVVGASQNILILQYLTETIMLTSFSVLVALGLVYFILPEFNLITGKNLQFEFSYSMIAMLTFVGLATGLLAGIYPAIYISGFRPVSILKGKVSSSFMELMVRKGLVVFQFALSIIFIIGVLVIYQQINFIQSKDAGYDKDALMSFNADGNIRSKASTFLNEVKKFHGVVNASSMFGSLTGETNGLPGFIEIDGKRITMYGIGVNYDMLETLGLRLKDGRFFSRESDHDSDTMKWIFNEAAVKAIGEDNVVGKVISDREVIGVVKDFHFQSLHEKVKPFAFRLEPYYCMDIWVRLRSGQEKQTIEYLRKIYSKFNPGFEFNYTVLSRAYEAQYRGEQRVAGLSKYFACVAIVISCLGLFGLAAFNTERRKKEIGIRKVLGSTEMSIIYLLTGDFSRMVIIAIMIAVPVSYVAALKWLNTFAYTIQLQWWYFAAGGLIALAIAWLTVGSLTIKAARTNPVDSLKNE